MFYDLGYRIAFVHIPRTGGVALTLAFRDILGLGGGWDLGVRRHLPLRDLVAYLGPDAHGLRFFTVWRDPREIKESFGRLIARDLAALDRGASFSPSWTMVLTARDPVAATWRLAGWPDVSDETAWRSFWLGDGSPPVRLLRFSSLVADLTGLCKEWRLPPVRMPDGRMN